MDYTEYTNVNTITKLIGKQIEVKTVDNKSHTGNLYVIDPDTGTTILTRSEEGKEDINLKIIPFNSIAAFEITGNSGGEIPNIFNDVKKPAVDLEKRKSDLVEWFKQNFLDVVEEGNVLKYGDSVVIEPPYDLNSCYCDNTVVLDRIRSIVSKCP